MKKIWFLLVSLMFVSCSTPFDDSFLKEEINKLKKENSEQTDALNSLEKRVAALEKAQENFLNLKADIDNLDTYTKYLNSKIENYNYDDSSLIESINNFKNNLTNDYVNFQTNLMKAFQDEHLDLLNKSVEELTEDIKRLEKMILEDKSLDELKQFTYELSNRIDTLKQVDLITIDNRGFAYFWNIDKKLLRVDDYCYVTYSDGLLSSIYFDNGKDHIFFKEDCIVYPERDGRGHRYYCPICDKTIVFSVYFINQSLNNYHGNCYNYKDECFINMKFYIEEQRYARERIGLCYEFFNRHAEYYSTDHLELPGDEYFTYINKEIDKRYY